jgi:hypothetical protein
MLPAARQLADDIRALYAKAVNNEPQQIVQTLT